MPVRKAIVPVAGFGTRFLPATKATPKEMFPLVDKPLTQYVVEEAVAAGVEEIIFVTGQAKRAIEDHFDSNFELEHLLETKGKHEQLKQVRAISAMCKFAYVRQPKARGLGDAILQAKNLVNNEPFAILTPDDVFTGTASALKDLVAVYDRTESPVVGVVEVPEDRLQLYGIVAGEETDDGLFKMSGTIEKPDPGDAPSQLAQCGRYIMVPELFEILERLPEGKGGEVQVTDAFNELAKSRDVFAAKIDGTYHDAGSKIGYLKAFVEFALAREDVADEFRTFLRDYLKK